MKTYRPALFIAVLLLTGCAGSEHHASSSNEQSSSWWNPVTWAWSNIAPWNWFDENLAITEQGVGSITGATAFQQEAITEGLYGRYTLRRGMRMNDGQVVSFWQARKDDQVAMILSGETTISRIEVLDPDVATDSDIHIGTPFSDVYSKAFNVCQKLSGTDKTSIICQAPGSQHIQYVFSGNWHGPENLMPADDTLQSWTVSKIIWQR